ncbi:MAG TPA: class II aldolase/adducin family protein [Dehalococcoidia bacterium]|nr:class II aldolase/adducin family protein [Dehalococcoidia bacterium]
MSIDERYLRDLQAVGQDLLLMGLVSSHGGNLSVRLENGDVIITRHGCMLGHIDEAGLVGVREDGSAEGKASMDTGIHLAIYQDTGAGAVVHAHPRHAIALSLQGGEIRPQDLEGKHYLGERVPVVSEVKEIPAALKEHPIVVVAGHGSYARGADLWQALQWTSVLEESAQVLWLAKGQPA